MVTLTSTQVPRALTSTQLLHVLSALADAAAHMETRRAECLLLDKSLMVKVYSEKADQYAGLYRELTRPEGRYAHHEPTRI